MDIITVHGHEHVVVINGMAFELDPGMFDPTIHKIEWVAGQGVIYWEDGRENTLFGKDGYDVHIAPLVRAFGEEQRRVEDNVIILDAERRQRTYATAKAGQPVEPDPRSRGKNGTFTQAILAAQLAGKVPG
ncbi:MAG: hypothetical protein ACLSAH_02065 [Bilophila wadsworthia]